MSNAYSSFRFVEAKNGNKSGSCKKIISIIINILRHPLIPANYPTLLERFSAGVAQSSRAARPLPGRHEDEPRITLLRINKKLSLEIMRLDGADKYGAE